MADKTPFERNDLSIYDKAADAWWSDEIRWVRTLKNMVPARLAHFDRVVGWKDKHVLDLGCAGGFMAEAIHDRGAHVTGIDPAMDAIEAARTHAARSDRSITYLVGVGEALPIGDDTFDSVVCVDVLEHVQDLTKVLGEVARVLKPGGHFLFDTINRNGLSRFATVTVAESLLGLLPRGTHDPVMFIKPDELRGALRDAGLTPSRFVGLGPRGLDRRGDFIFGKVPSTAIIYMGSARKA